MHAISLHFFIQLIPTDWVLMINQNREVCIICNLLPRIDKTMDTFNSGKSFSIGFVNLFSLLNRVVDVF